MQRDDNSLFSLAKASFATQDFQNVEIGKI
jgi:hypothetical protein